MGGNCTLTVLKCRERWRKFRSVKHKYSIYTADCTYMLVISFLLITSVWWWVLELLCATNKPSIWSFGVLAPQTSVSESSFSLLLVWSESDWTPKYGETWLRLDWWTWFPFILLLLDEDRIRFSFRLGIWRQRLSNNLHIMLKAVVIKLPWKLPESHSEYLHKVFKSEIWWGKKIFEILIW